MARCTVTKVSKNPKIYCIHNSLPKNAKSPFGFFGLLGVKYQISNVIVEWSIMPIKHYSIFIKNAFKNMYKE
jgi:hypothetical protein